MSNLSNKTSDISIQRPELWDLVLRLDDDAITFVVYSQHVDNSIISRRIEIDKTSSDYLRAVENAVYDNPVLLLDYNSVKISVRSEHFIIMPREVVSADDVTEAAEDMFCKVYTEPEGTICQCDLFDGGPKMVFEIPKGVELFLQRTFNNPPIVHHLAPFVHYFHEKSEQSGISKMYLHFDNGKMELSIFRRGEFVMANTFSFRAANDALFFAMHAWQTYGCDQLVDEVQLSGDKSVRDVLTPLLRKYINYVMPVIFPAKAMKLGDDVIKAPFDLILLSICE